MKKDKNPEGVVEAVLFIAGRFLSLNDLVMYTGINPLTLRDTLQKLEEKYKNYAGALNIMVKGELYKMEIKQEFSWLTNKLASGTTEFTKAEQETLAIIAYKQPINQSLVVRIRGNKAYDHVKKLVEVGLIKTKRVSHTLELRLDDAFYNYFGIKAKERLEMQQSAGEGAEGLLSPPQVQTLEITTPLDKIAEAEIEEAKAEASGEIKKEQGQAEQEQELGESKSEEDNNPSQ